MLAASLAPEAADVPAKSIAVLPFENLSEDQANAYFAVGIQDEILTSLARVADLKVISRTSIMQYKAGRRRNLREIGKELGVAHLSKAACSVLRTASGQRPVDRRPQRRASVGADLRSRSGRCLRHPKRNRQGDRRPVAGEALA